MAMVTRAAMCMLLLGLATAVAVGAETQANPIRKVVTLMQNMQKEIEDTGVKEKALFDNFMCFCQNGDTDLKANVVKASGEIKAFKAKIAGETAEKAQMAVEIKQHEQDQAAAQKDLAEAQNMREKENAEHMALTADLKTNMNGVARAIPALEKGMGGAAFMQMPGSDTLANLLDTFPFSDQNDRRTLLAFVQSSGDYAPASGQIVGILKGMKDTMEEQIAEAVKEEEGAKSSFDELKASKQSEAQIAKQAISSKTKRSGDLAVSLAADKDGQEDSEGEFADTERLIEQLTTQCATKEKEWAERSKLRAQEVLAISEAIGILNDDDALDTFKKALPSSAALMQRTTSLLQRSQSTKASALVRARTLLAHVASLGASGPLRLMLFTLKSKIKQAQGAGSRADFSDVISMIDDMVKLLKKNQVDDDTQKDFCRVEFHKSHGEEVATQRELDKVKNMIEERNDMVAQLASDITGLEEGIKALDKTVAVATEQRKKEHAESVQTATMNQAALELVDKARNRMAKFYTPSEYKAPPTTTADPSPYGFVQLSSEVRSHRVAPPQAPETFGSYEKQGQSTGVLMMMKQIMNDIELDMQDGARDEKDAQTEYTELMGDSAEDRAQKEKSIVQKEAAKAKLQIKIERNWERRRSTEEELANIQEYIRDLHSKCDFLMKNYDERKVMRATEQDSLNKAKAVLSGMAA